MLKRQIDSKKAISIHAPREGSDLLEQMAWKLVDISIHAPREGSDAQLLIDVLQLLAFQSTLPVRGAT